jgi:pyridoxamine 5'-phosphate oxidase
VNSILPPWRSSIARALHRNRSLPYARYVQLATIDRTNRPRNRTVVFRGWREPESQLQFVVDIRSQKAYDLLSNHPKSADGAEICWYFPKTREQFRISGELLLVTAESATERDCKARQAAWQQLSDGGRIQFAWAMPGADRSPDPDAFNPPPPDSQQPLANFCLLLLAPVSVDHLELRGEPQNRYSYELVGAEWMVREVNP